MVFTALLVESAVAVGVASALVMWARRRFIPQGNR